MKVGVRELKARLSRYLDLAGDGEIIVVTLRGRPKAVLGPAGGSAQPGTASDFLEQGIREGWISAGKGRVDLTRRKSYKSPSSVARLIDEDRSE